MRESCRRDQGGVLDAHTMVGIIVRLEPTQNGDRILDARLADIHRLEAAFESFVLFNMLTVLLKRSRTDTT